MSRICNNKNCQNANNCNAKVLADNAGGIYLRLMARMHSLTRPFCAHAHVARHLGPVALPDVTSFLSLLGGLLLSNCSHSLDEVRQRLLGWILGAPTSSCRISHLGTRDTSTISFDKRNS